MPGTGGARTAYPSRLVGVDLARLLALLGMFAAHVVDPEEASGLGGVNGLFQLVAGRSSALFAVLAGVSLAIVTRGLAADPAGHRRRLVVRAGVVAVLGLWLGLFGSGVAVILTYYGLLFCCALPVLRWRASSLAWLALGWALISPVLSLLLRRVLPPTTYQVPSLVSLADPVQLLGELLVTGYYPVLTWATYLFAGLAVGRLLTPALGGADRDLPLTTIRTLLLAGAGLTALGLATSALITRSAGVRGALLGSWDQGGPWGSLVRELRRGFYGTHPDGSFWWLGVWAPHSGSIVDLVHTGGSALLVLGLCLAAVRLLPAVPWRVVAGGGAMTLTLYCAHVLLLASPLGQSGPLARGAEHALLLHAALAMVIGAAFALQGAPGPLERAVRAATRAVPLRR